MSRRPDSSLPYRPTTVSPIFATAGRFQASYSSVRAVSSASVSAPRPGRGAVTMLRLGEVPPGFPAASWTGSTHAAAFFPERLNSPPERSLVRYTTAGRFPFFALVVLSILHIELEDGARRESAVFLVSEGHPNERAPSVDVDAQTEEVAGG